MQYKIVAILLYLLSASVPASAFALSFCRTYTGIQLGEASNHYPLSMLGLQSGTVHYQGFSGRVYLGYQLNRYIGLESGFLRFLPARVHNINHLIVNGRVEDYSVDLLLAGNLPFQNGYYIFGKFGAAYHFAQPSHSIRTVSTTDYANETVAHYRPIGILGIGYAVSRHIGLDVNYTQVYKHRTMPKGSLWALGLTYYFSEHFNDKTLMVS